MTRRRGIGAAGLVVLGAALGGLAVQRRSDDRQVKRICRRLEETQSSGRVFAPDELPDLPDPARRFFIPLFNIHAIQPGTVLASKAHLRQVGAIRFGASWLPFGAEQVLVPGRAFVWSAATRLGPLPFAPPLTIWQRAQKMGGVFRLAFDALDRLSLCGAYRHETLLVRALISGHLPDDAR